MNFRTWLWWSTFNFARVVFEEPHESRELLRTYLEQSRELGLSRLQLFDFPAWLASQHVSGMAAGVPWITFGAARSLGRIVNSGTRVLEYGSGGSTVYLSRRAKEVVSIEHDPEWANQVRQAVDNATTILLRQPEGETRDDPGDVSAFASSDPTFRAKSFRSYVMAAAAFPDGHFDVLIVDGRARPSALVYAQRKVRLGGAILLDDSDRPLYEAARRFAIDAGWPRQVFRGPKPASTSFAETTVWIKTSEPADVRVIDDSRAGGRIGDA
jgi:hypothetical protein